MTEKEKERPKISRRQFVEVAAAATAGGAVGAAAMRGLLPPLVITNTNSTTVPQLVPTQVIVYRDVPTPVRFDLANQVITFDPSYCVGCLSCEYFCSTYHEGLVSRPLSRLTLDRYPPSVTLSVDVCRQCAAAPCIYACSPGAMYVDKVTGARMIDATKCIGCGLCAKACPYNSDGHIIKYNASKNVYVKCDMCTGRADGPACVQACKWGALEVKKL